MYPEKFIYKFVYRLLNAILILSITIVYLMDNVLHSIKKTEQEAGDWARATLSSMTVEQKIGQLFMVSDLTPSARAGIAETDWTQLPYNTGSNYIEKLIREYHIGGIIFLGKNGSPIDQVHMTHNYNQMSKIPLLIGLDAEWGLAMRLNNTTIQFPKNMTLGAISNQKMCYAVGKEIGQQCIKLGVHINFAPVVDVNTNPNNPVIGARSFGQDKQEVAQRAIEYMHGLLDAGVIPCAKHFPGHGDTSIDSHYDLPIIIHDYSRIEDIELYPFKQLIAAKIPAIMTAHLNVPSLTAHKESPEPVTLSKEILNQILFKKMKFSGLVITDGLGMQALTNYYEPGELELKAFLAGNDILLCPVDVPKAFNLITQAVKEKKITEEELNQRVLKILYAKEWALHNKKSEPINSFDEASLISTDALELKRQLYTQAITLVCNYQNTLPLVHDDDEYELITVGTLENNTDFQKAISQKFTLKKIQLEHLEHSTKTLLVAIYPDCKTPQQISSEIQNIVKNILAGHRPCILTYFTNPYALCSLQDTLEQRAAPTALVIAYEDDIDAQIAAAHTIMGLHKPTGKLPVTAGAYNVGTGQTYY